MSFREDCCRHTRPASPPRAKRGIFPPKKLPVQIVILSHAVSCHVMPCLKNYPSDLSSCPMPCHAMPCLYHLPAARHLFNSGALTSCHVLSCHVLSCHVTSCHVTSRHAISSPRGPAPSQLCCPRVLSCPVLSCPVTSCHVTSRHLISPPRGPAPSQLRCPLVQSCPVISCHTMSCHVVPSHLTAARRLPGPGALVSEHTPLEAHHRLHLARSVRLEGRKGVVRQGEKTAFPPNNEARE